LGGKLGDGAAALVRRAQKIGDHREFAIKFLAPDPKYINEAVFDDVAARFRREGERSQKLSHGSLVQIHAYEENKNGNAFGSGGPKNPFIVMEEVKGNTLENYIRREERRWTEKKMNRAFSLTSDRHSRKQMKSVQSLKGNIKRHNGRSTQPRSRVGLLQSSMTGKFSRNWVRQ
jgi:serine/threonine protein kinase